VAVEVLGELPVAAVRQVKEVQVAAADNIPATVPLLLKTML
jgi:hypothetical protein